MDNKRFEELIKQNYKWLYYYAGRFCKDEDEKNDLVQDTLEKAFKYKDNYKDQCKFSYWLSIIMKSIFINSHRLRNVKAYSKYGVFNDNREHIEMENVSLNKQIYYAENIEDDFELALSKVNEDYKICFLMSVIDGLEYKDVAETLCIPIGTVRSRINRARKILKQHLIG